MSLNTFKARAAGNHDFSSTSVATFASILQPLVDSGFVGASELGNLGQVSTQLKQATLEERIWACLCEKDYPATLRFNKNLFSSQGYRWLYKRWSCPIVKRRRPLPPLDVSPSCQARQLFFLVHIRYNGNPVYSDVLDGEHLSSLLEKGISGRKFQEPFVVGKAEWNYTEQEKLEYELHVSNPDLGLPVTCNGLDKSRIDAVIHVFRKTESDPSMTRVFDSKQFCGPYVKHFPLVHPVRLKRGETLTQETNIDARRRGESGYVSFGIAEDTLFTAWPLRHSKEAALIQERMDQPLFFKMRLILDAIAGGQFAITGFEISVHKDVIPLSGHPFPVFDSRVEKEKHGVTLLHVLSELQDM